ncbi:SHOCT domain-containing protein [Leuconostoc citreum]|uniref:SHOCT domain-containing protein n=1 Tax=Leuconostoc citreum TaxID=33964 RepID=UPI0031342C48
MGLFDGIKKEMQLSQEKAAIEKENKKKYDNYQIDLKSKFVASGRIGINKFNDELKIIKVSTESYFKDVYVEYKNITEVKIDEKINEKTQTKNVGKRKGVITRSVVGTILMPGVGTVVGGLTAKKENKIQSITTQDIKRKIVLIQNTPYQSLLKITYSEDLFSKLKSIINNNNETVEETMYKEERTDNGLSDLIALKELFDQGIITQDDFDAKKKQILGL